MEYAPPSKSNPALVMCIVDCSKSMIDSNALDHALAATTALRKHARGKRETIRLVVFGFADKIYRGYEGWCENVGQLRLGQGSQTHLKMACEKACEYYNDHIQLCRDDNPLVNVLIFTDGNHSPGLDTDFPFIGAAVPNKYWEPFHPNDWIKPIADLSNVLLGVIDYSTELPQFPLPGTVIGYNKKVTCCSVLEKALLEKAYARDLNNPPPRGQSLGEVFGPMEELLGKLFIVNASSIEESPQVTSAFIRLGTASTFGGFSDEGGDDGPPPNNNFDFTEWIFGSEVE
tara:strand:+ start:191 stop:1051 length:861 start_codon:yes stop_codon:yes gene_type:complete